MFRVQGLRALGLLGSRAEGFRLKAFLGLQGMKNPQTELEVDL